MKRENSNKQKMKKHLHRHLANKQMKRVIHESEAQASEPQAPLWVGKYW